MKNKFLILIKLLVVIILFIFIFELFPKAKKMVYISPDISSEKIALILKENNLVLNYRIFLIFTYLTNSDRKLKPGSYKLSYSLTGLPIIIKLRYGSKGIKITIPEGFRAEQIADRLFANGVITDPVGFMTYVQSKNLEGYLFPETYYFYQNENIEDICNKMFFEFKKRYNQEFITRANELKLSTKQVVILASIIEKEAKSYNEKEMISGIFHNRLKKGWQLESCATVRYALKKFKDKLTYKDTKVNSPYNTYKYSGLPPGAICNPGLDSIKSVLYPKETDAMFFFTQDNETHKFSKFYKKHLELQKKNTN